MTPSLAFLGSILGDRLQGFHWMKMHRPLEATNHPLVSVIVPSFNHANYLRSCIDSILCQDYDPIEIIVVDDNSKDGSVEILKSYGDRIIVLHQDGGRQAKGRNLGLQHSKGDLIAFLDSDDRYLQGRIRVAVDAFLDSNDIDVVWGDYRTIDSHGAAIAEHRWIAKNSDFAKELISGNPICNATVTVKRNKIEEIGGFDERVPRVCDGAAWYQLAAKGYQFKHIPRLLLDYRVHDNNDSKRFVPMTLDRDTALVSGVEAYLTNGIISTDRDRKWLRNVVAKQFAFRAAATVQRSISHSLRSQIQAKALETFGSTTCLKLLAIVQGFKQSTERLFS